jgi:tRNA-splicing ligase RtcB
MPFVGPFIAAMPDVHVGRGATVGSVIPTNQAIIPAAVGVDIGCGMTAVRTSLKGDCLPDNLSLLRASIEAAVPHGRTSGGMRGDRGAWGTPPDSILHAFKNYLAAGLAVITSKHPKAAKANDVSHLGTLGTGNHFIELCLDEQNFLWIVLHTGSRGIGNRIGTYFIELAKLEMLNLGIHLVDQDLAYLPEGCPYFGDYCEALLWAQNYAAQNRRLILETVVNVLSSSAQLPSFTLTSTVVDCHHNYVTKESHFGQNLWITRKGAIRARKNDFGIIPGSMGTRSFIVRGKGESQSLESASHGAGRLMSRTEAKQRFTLEDHSIATQGIECRKDKGVLDETPLAYKDIDAVMVAQTSLVEIVHTLRQLVCVKG